MSNLDEPDISPSFAATKPHLCYIVTDDDEVYRVMFRTSDIAAKREIANEVGCNISDLSARRKPEWDQYVNKGVPALVRIDDGWWFECEGCGTWISDEYIGTRERRHDGIEEYQLDREYGLDLERPEMTPVEPKRGHVWCHQSCYERDFAARNQRRRWEERIHAWLVRRLLKRMPDAEPLPLPDASPGECSVYGGAPEHSYVYVAERKRVYDRRKAPHGGYDSHSIHGHEVCEASVHFRWPGAKYGCATLRICDQRYQGRPRRAEFYCSGGDREAFTAWWAGAQRTEWTPEVVA